MIFLCFTADWYNIMYNSLIKRHTQMTFVKLCYFQCFISSISNDFFIFYLSTWNSDLVPVMNVFWFLQTYIQNDSTNIAQVPFLENDDLVHFKFLGPANISAVEKRGTQYVVQFLAGTSFQPKKLASDIFLWPYHFCKRMDSKRIYNYIVKTSIWSAYPFFYFPHLWSG